MKLRASAVAIAIWSLNLAACDRQAGESTAAATEDNRPAVDTVLARVVAAAQAGADSVVEALRPVPLMTAAEENALRRYGNEQHLARARALGARPADAADRARLIEQGRLVRVPDTTALFVLRTADASSAYLTPGALRLLEDVARRFQAALAERGLPAYRLEVSSMLRTAEDQAALRRVNPNAAAGTSTHEFGTTLDIVYESWAAPAELPAAYLPREPALVPYAETTARALLERAAAQKSRELTAILGAVLLELQSAGAVYVTLERQQPVFHITVAR